MDVVQRALYEQRLKEKKEKEEQSKNTPSSDAKEEREEIVDNDASSDNNAKPEQKEDRTNRRLPSTPNDGVDYVQAEQVTQEVSYGGESTSTVNTKKDVEKVPTNAQLRGYARKRHKREVSRENNDGVELAHIKSIPKSVLELAKREFPSLTNPNAVVAYICASANEIPQDVTDDVYDACMEKLKEKKDLDPLYGIASSLTNLEKTTREQTAYIRELELALSYLLFDRLGYRRERASLPENVNILENGVEDLIRRIREQAKVFIQRENQSNGRPRRN